MTVRGTCTDEEVEAQEEAALGLMTNIRCLNPRLSNASLSSGSQVAVKGLHSPAEA